MRNLKVAICRYYEANLVCHEQGKAGRDCSDLKVCCLMEAYVTRGPISSKGIDQNYID